MKHVNQRVIASIASNVFSKTESEYVDQGSNVT